MTRKEALKMFYQELKKHFKNLLNGNIKRELANILTFSRGFISPLVLIPTILYCSPAIAILAVTSFALTDLFDGKIARKFNSIDDFGKTLDAVCDKLFEAGIAVPLIMLNPILSLTAILELIIAKINVISFLSGNKPETIFLGKVKTFALSSTLIFSYITKFINVSSIPLYTLIGITTLFQLVAIFQYKHIDNIKNMKKNYEGIDDFNFEEVKEQEKVLTKQLTNSSKKIKNLKDMRDILINSQVQNEEEIKKDSQKTNNLK